MDDGQLKELFGEVPYWADQVIEKHQPLPEDAREFITTSYWSGKASVNLQDVCGTMHPDYAGLTWREFLDKGRRMAGNLADFKRNPAYYTDESIQRLPSMHFHRLDGKTFVTEDGNHRTCIGRFYLYGLHGHDCPYIHRVTLTDEVLDWEFVALYRHLLDKAPIDWRITPGREVIRREDGPGWKRDFFTTVLKISVAGGPEHICDKAEIKAEIFSRV
ncbi:MAG TPA: hypothetical protein DEB25_03520 [Desulfobulbaceae bacterium]|nr:hypothetical protein [Desulfobulbaceae bacterium]